MTYFQLRQLEQRQVELRREIDDDHDDDIWTLLMDSLGVYEGIAYIRHHIFGLPAETTTAHHDEYSIDGPVDESGRGAGSLYRLSRVSDRVKPLVVGLERASSLHSHSSSSSQGSAQLSALQQGHTSYVGRAAQYALSGLTTLVQGSRAAGRSEYELVRNYTDTFTLQDLDDDEDNNDDEDLE